jgi:hypothetical protein
VLGRRRDQVAFGLDHPVRVQVVTQPDHTGRGGTRLLRLMRQPGRRTGGTHVVAHTGLVGVRGDEGLQLHHLRFQAGQLHQGRPGLGLAHGPHRCVHHRVRDTTHPRGRSSHQVAGGGHRCHGPSQPPPRPVRIRCTEACGGPCRKHACARKVACGVPRTNVRTTGKHPPQTAPSLVDGVGSPRPATRKATTTTSPPYPPNCPLGGPPGPTRNPSSPPRPGRTRAQAEVARSISATRNASSRDCTRLSRGSQTDS